MAVNASIHLSVDGVMEEPEGWSIPYFDHTAAAYARAQLDASAGLLLGRRTYERFAAAGRPIAGENGCAERMDAVPKHVVTSRPGPLTWGGATPLRGAVAESVRTLRDRAPGDLLIYGSGQLVRALLAEGLIDELRLWVHPVVVGRGRRLFPEGGPSQDLTLSSCRTLGSGVTILGYAPAAANVTTTSVATGAGAPA